MLNELTTTYLLLPSGFDVESVLTTQQAPFVLGVVTGTTPAELKDMVWRIGTAQEQGRTYSTLLTLRSPDPEPGTEDQHRWEYRQQIDRLEQICPDIIICTASGDRNLW